MSYKFCALDGDTRDSICAVAKEHCERSKNLEELIYAWLTPERRASFGPGVLEGTDIHCATVILSNRRKEIGYIDIPFDELPKVEPVSEAIHGPLPRDDWFEERDKQFKFTWNSALCSETLNRADALAMAVSYALADMGEAFFSLDDPEPDISCEEDEKAAPKSKYIVAVGYLFTDCSKINGTPGYRQGWGENYYVLP